MLSDIDGVAWIDVADDVAGAGRCWLRHTNLIVEATAHGLVVEYAGCVARLNDGRICGGYVQKDYQGPVPLCRRHRDEMMEVMFDRCVERYRNGLALQLETAHGGLSPSAAARARTLAEAGRHGCVYYLRIVANGLVKIGATVDLPSRVRAHERRFGDCVLLATERGHYDLEAARHEQFAALRRSRSELFAYDEPLVGHIAALRPESDA